MCRIMCLDEIELGPKPRDTVVERLSWDWGDTSKVPRSERRRILDNHLPGCWLINPQYKVHGRSLTPGFFWTARDCQAEWFRTLDLAFPRGWRNLLAATPIGIERRAAFTGILIIDGVECDPQNWNTIERLLGLRPRVDYRSEAFHMVKREDWQGLIQLSRTELQKEIGADPDIALFVTPGITVAGLPLHPFYKEIGKRCCEWSCYLTRVLGLQRASTYARHSSCVTRMLAFNGTLVIDGEFYVPGLWPGRTLTKAKLAQSPYGEPTVPPEYLGL